MRYAIFYKQLQIGTLEINDEGQYRYTPNNDALSYIKESVSLSHELVEKTDWTSPIPFFKERIDNASRFQKEEISYHTDLFRMIKEN